MIDIMPVSTDAAKSQPRNPHQGNDTPAQTASINDAAPNKGPLRQLLARMQQGALVARRDPVDPDYVILVRASERGSLSAGRAQRSLVDEGLRAGCLIKSKQGVISVAPDLEMSSERVPSPAGSGSAPSHDVKLPRQMPEDVQAPPTLTVNHAESPLLWLRRRKGTDGQPLLDDAEFLAGERFRRDVTAASMLPSVTTNWSRLETSTGRALPRDPALASDVTIAARQRVRAAFRVLGSDMAHFVLDVCAFLVPLQEAEARRCWPSRSGKLVLRMALKQLAAHYGLNASATGPATGRMSAWQQDPQRVSIQSWLAQPDA